MSENVAQDQNPNFVRVSYPGNLSLTYFYVQDTREDNKLWLTVPVVVVDSHDRTSVCIDVFTGRMPPKTA